MVVYDLSTGTTPVLLGALNFPSPGTRNGNRVGAVDFLGDKLYAVDTQNGVVAAQVLYTPQARITAPPVGQRTVVLGGYTSLTVDAAFSDGSSVYPARRLVQFVFVAGGKEPSEEYPYEGRQPDEG